MVVVPMKGSCMWVCGSMPPGITYWPPASTTVVPAGAFSQARRPPPHLAALRQHVGGEGTVGIHHGAALDQDTAHQLPK